MKKYHVMYIGKDKFQIHISEDAIRYAYKNVEHLDELVQEICSISITNRVPNKIILLDVIGGKIR